MRFFKKIRSHSRLIIVGAVLALIIVAVAADRVTGRSVAPTQARQAPVPVTAAVATRADVPEIVDAIGTVQSIDAVAVQARVTGAIEKIEFTPGQDVKNGQEMFLIDARPYQAALDQAKAQLAHDEASLEEAQVDLERYQTLEQQKSIAAQQAQDQAYVVAQDKGTVQLDQANVETAQLNLDYCHIAAPVSGRAGALLVDLGNLVGPNTSQNQSSTTTTTASATGGQSTTGTTMVTIAQTQPIYVSFNVTQNVLDEIRRNQAAAPLEVDAYSEAGKLIEKGKLTLINNEVNAATGTVLMQATFANSGEVLWPGEFVTVGLIVATQRNVVTVPASAVMVGPNGDYVYVIGSDDKVTRVAIQQGARRGGISVISKGISAGQKVVATGQYRLDNGTVVAVRQAAAPQPAAQTAADAQPAAVDRPQ